MTLNLRDTPFCGVTAPNDECQSNIDRVAVILQAHLEQNITDEENLVLDLVTDLLIYNRFVNGQSPDELLERAQRAYFSQLADANVWA